MPKLSAKALVSALPYRIKQDFEELHYKVYMSDLALAMAKRVIQPAEKPPRYWDIINPKPEETRTADEVIAHIKNKIREVS